MTIDLRNKKILVEHLPESQKIAIQEEAFRQGFKWAGNGETNLKHLDKGSYYFWDDYDLTHTRRGDSYFYSNNKEEIFYQDIFPPTNPRPHAELIKQWADDDSLVIEGRCKILGGVWMEAMSPNWYPDQEYRIKPVEAPQYKDNEVDARIASLEKYVESLKEARKAEKGHQRGIDIKPIQAGDYIPMSVLNEETYHIVCKAFEEAGYPRIEGKSYDNTPHQLCLLALDDTVWGPRFLSCRPNNLNKKRRRYISEFI